MLNNVVPAAKHAMKAHTGHGCKDLHIVYLGNRPEVNDKLYILVVLVHGTESLVYTEYEDVRAQQMFWT
jgi:hypothetical protein